MILRVGQVLRATRQHFAFEENRSPSIATIEEDDLLLILERHGTAQARALLLERGAVVQIVSLPEEDAFGVPATYVEL